MVPALLSLSRISATSLSPSGIIWAGLLATAASSLPGPTGQQQNLGFSRPPGIPAPKYLQAPGPHTHSGISCLEVWLGWGWKLSFCHLRWLQASGLLMGVSAPGLQEAPGQGNAVIWSRASLRSGDFSERGRECRQQPLQSVNPWEGRREYIQGKPTWDFGGQGRA